GGGGEEHAVDEDRGEQDEERRDAPTDPPAVEGQGVDATVAVQLLDEEPHDEEPGEDEEDVHRDPRPGYPTDPEVEGHEGDHGHPAHTVERGAVPVPRTTHPVDPRAALS